MKPLWQNYKKAKYKSMDRIKYQEVLESIKIPDGMTQEEMVDALKPLNIALLQMIPKRLYKYRSCKDEHISAFEKDELWLSTSDLFNDPFDTLIQYDEGKIRSAFDCISQPDIFDAMLNHIAAGGEIAEPVNHLIDPAEIESMRVKAAEVLSFGKQGTNDTLNNPERGVFDLIAQDCSAFFIRGMLFRENRFDINVESLFI